SPEIQTSPPAAVHGGDTTRWRSVQKQSVVSSRGAAIARTARPVLGVPRESMPLHRDVQTPRTCHRRNGPSPCHPAPCACAIAEHTGKRNRGEKCSPKRVKFPPLVASPPPTESVDRSPEHPR